MVPSEARGAALVRMAMGVIFVAFGYGKITGDFVRGGFGKDAGEAAREAWPFWRPVLEGVVVPNAEAFGWIFAVAELAVGIGLLLGFPTRVAAAGGMALMLAILLNQTYVPGESWHGWVTAGLNAKLAFLAFALLFLTNSGRVWGLDGRIRKSPRVSRRV